MNHRLAAVGWACMFVATACATSSAPPPRRLDITPVIDLTANVAAKCTSRGHTWDGTACILDFSPTPAEIAACDAKGGTFMPAVMTSSCAWPTRDAGKACRDSTECEGACVVPLDTPGGARITGACEAVAGVPECTNFLLDGAATGHVCP